VFIMAKKHIFVFRLLFFYNTANFDFVAAESSGNSLSSSHWIENHCTSLSTNFAQF
jgi:hypothetical protein